MEQARQKYNFTDLTATQNSNENVKNIVYLYFLLYKDTWFCCYLKDTFVLKFIQKNALLIEPNTLALIETKIHSIDAWGTKMDRMLFF